MKHLLLGSGQRAAQDCDGREGETHEASITIIPFSDRMSESRPRAQLGGPTELKRQTRG